MIQKRRNTFCQILYDHGVDLDLFEKTEEGWSYKIEEDHFIVIIKSSYNNLITGIHECHYRNPTLSINICNMDQMMYIINKVKEIKKDQTVKRVQHH